MIKVLEYKEVIVDKALVIEIANDVELIIRRKKSKSSIFKVLKDILSVESWDSQDKNNAMNSIRDRITFK